MNLYQWFQASIISDTEVSVTVLCLLCSPHYTIKNCLKSIFVIKVATKKNTDDFRYTKEAIGVQLPNQR